MPKELGRMRGHIPAVGDMEMWVVPHYSRKGVIRVFTLEPDWYGGKVFTLEARPLVPFVEKVVEGLCLGERFRLSVHSDGPYGRVNTLSVNGYGPNNPAFNLIEYNGSVFNWTFCQDTVLEMLAVIGNSATRLLAKEEK